MMSGVPGTTLGCTVRALDGEERRSSSGGATYRARATANGRILLSFADHTNNMNAFKRLESEKRFDDAIIDFAESLIIGMDMEGTVMIFNRKAEQTTGMRRRTSWARTISPFSTRRPTPRAGKRGCRKWPTESVRWKGSRHCRERVTDRSSGGTTRSCRAATGWSWWGSGWT